MKKFTSYGLSCSVHNDNGSANLSFDTNKCYWEARVYPKDTENVYYKSLSYRKVCNWFTEQLNKYDIK